MNKEEFTTCEIVQENQHLKDEIDWYEQTLSRVRNKKEKYLNNWNELKEWLEEKTSVYEHQEASNFYVALSKMQEIESRK